MLNRTAIALYLKEMLLIGVVLTATLVLLVVSTTVLAQKIEKTVAMQRSAVHEQTAQEDKKPPLLVEGSLHLYIQYLLPLCFLFLFKNENMNFNFSHKCFNPTNGRRKPT